jgi:hypothetical protein
MANSLKTSQKELLRIIVRRECPFCEGTKLDGCMFCDACYAKLPADIKSKIHNGLRQLSEAIRAGITFLEG